MATTVWSPTPPCARLQCWEHLSAPGNAASTFGSETQFAARFPFLPAPPASAPMAGAAAAGAAPDASESNGSSHAEAAAPSEAAAEALAGAQQAGAGASAASPTAAADRQLLLRFALALMLYQPPSAKGPANPLAAAQAAAAGGASGGRGPAPMEVDASPAPGGAGAAQGAPVAAGTAGPPAGVPAGMSQQEVAAVEGKALPAGGGRAFSRVPSAWKPLQPQAWGMPCAAGRLCACWPKGRVCCVVPCLPVQAMRCCAASWASSTSRRPPGGNPPRYCKSTWQLPATQMSRSAGRPGGSYRREYLCLSYNKVCTVC